MLCVKCFAIDVKCRLWKRERARTIMASEMWIWKRMEQMKWVDKVSNDKVLNRIMQNMSTFGALRRQGNWLGILTEKKEY